MNSFEKLLQDMNPTVRNQILTAHVELAKELFINYKKNEYSTLSALKLSFEDANEFFEKAIGLNSKWINYGQ